MPATPGGVPFLGVAASAIDTCGIRIVSVLANSPADKAGLQAGDAIVAINGTSISSILSGGAATGSSATTAATGTVTPNPVQPFFTYFETTFQPGQTITLTIQRDTVQFDMRVTLGTVPPGLITAAPSNTSASANTMAPATATSTAPATAVVTSTVIKPTLQPSATGTLKISPTGPATGVSSS
jgi:membrane-associated protease RseP (regulator of RpoE activity)